MHSPSRVQIPPSPQSLTALREPRPRLGRGFAVRDTAGVSASAASLPCVRTKLKALCSPIYLPAVGKLGQMDQRLHTCTLAAILLSSASTLSQFGASRAIFHLP